MAPITGGALQYVDSGGIGAAVLFLPSFPFDSESWRTQIDSIARAGHRGIALDARGIVRSAPVMRVTTPADIADDAAMLLRFLCLERAVVCGHGMGALAAFEMAQRHPKMVRGLIAIAPRARVATAAEREALEAIATAALAHGSSSVADKLLPLMGTPPALASDVSRRIGAATPAGIAAAARGYAQRPETPFSIIRSPAVIIRGSKDGIVVEEEAAAVAGALPKARLLQTIEGAGHLVHLERPAEVGAEVVELVSWLAVAGR